MARPAAFSLDGDVAIVTGAGSRLDGEIGNGRAAAILLARQGAKVALLDFKVEWAQETKRMIEKDGGVSHVIKCDVTSEEDCKKAVEETVNKWGALQILVNNVGVGGPFGTACDVNMDEWDRDWRINVTSMVLMSRFAIPEMKKSGRGAIVNLASVSGMIGGNPSLLYPTSKGAIIHLTRSMAANHGPDNIRVNCVSPGMVYTPMVRENGMSDEIRRRRVEGTLLRQEGTGWDIGYAIVYLTSREARWVTGVNLPVDAGTTAGTLGRPSMAEDLNNK